MTLLASLLPLAPDGRADASEEVVMEDADAFGWRSALYPQSWTPPGPDRSFYTDKLIQDFSRVGYRNGTAPLPDVSGPVYDVAQPPYSADQTGTTDSTAAIQAAIDDAAASGGGVVYLPAGTYLVAPPPAANQALLIASSNIVLRGAGIGSTFICNTETNMRSKQVISVAGPASAAWTADHEPSTFICYDLPGPTRVIPVESAAPFAVGDRIIIRADVTMAWTADHAEPEWEDWAPTFHGFAYPRRIVDIDPDGRTLFVDIPTRYALFTRDNARVHPAGPALSEVGLEDFSIGNLQHSGSGTSEGDYTNPGTLAYDVHGSFLIRLIYARDCWVRRVSSYRPPQNTLDTHMLSNGILLSRTHATTLIDVSMQGVLYGGGGGNGYLFRMSNASDNLLTRCVGSRSRHGFAYTHWASSGNVIHRSTDHVTQWSSAGPVRGSGSDHHMQFSHSNLADANTMDDSFFDARYRPFGTGPKHRISAAHSIFWNTTGEGPPERGAVVRSQQARYGYVIGTQGSRTAVDTLGSLAQTNPIDHVEGVGEAPQLVPQSLYEDQLARNSSQVELHVLPYQEIDFFRNVVELAAFLDIPLSLAHLEDDIEVVWDLIGGPGGAELSPRPSTRPTLTVSVPGVYVLRATVSGSGLPPVSAVSRVRFLPPPMSGLSAQQVAFSPTHDAHVHLASPATNFGSEPDMMFKALGNANERQIFLKFDLSAATGALQRATLHFTETVVGTNYAGRVLRGTSNNWSENTITYNSRPPVDSNAVVATWSSSPITQPRAREIDVTSAVQTALSGGGVLTLAMQITSQANDAPTMRIASKEHATSAYHPRVVLEMAVESRIAYSVWAAQQGLAGTDAAPEADPAATGSPNLVRYLTGAIDGAEESDFLMLQPGQPPALNVDLPWRLLARDPGHVVVERSTDLSVWRLAGLRAWQATGPEDGRVRFSALESRPPGEDFEFFRFRYFFTPDVDNTLHVIIGLGQSLMVGSQSAGTLVSTASPRPADVLMFNAGVNSDVRMGLVTSGEPQATLDPASLTGFLPLVAKVGQGGGSRGETVMEALANHLAADAEERGTRYRSLSLTAAHGGSSYAVLKKGSQVYSNMLAALGRAKTLAEAQGWKIVVPACLLKHGESDSDNPNYLADLLVWRSDVDADVKAITGQSESVHFIMGQPSTHLGSTPHSALAMLEAHNTSPYHHLSGPDYPFGEAYASDELHMTGLGYHLIGEQMARTWKQLLGPVPVPPRITQILSACRTGLDVKLTYEVPAPPLVFDTLTVSERDVKGFRYADHAGDIAILSATITDPGIGTGLGEVTLELATLPSGQQERVRYALTPQTSPRTPMGRVRGNLRDSAPEVSAMDGRPLYNWAVHQQVTVEPCTF